MGDLFKRFGEKKMETPIVPLRKDMPAPKTGEYLIRDGRLQNANFIPDPEAGRPMAPRGIVIHFTASYNLRDTVNWFKQNTVDIHLLLDKNGEFTQMVPFHRTSDHAGKSEWKGYEGLNSKFIGIEVICLGPLSMKDGSLVDCYNRKFAGKINHVKMLGYEYWEAFSEDQTRSLIGACKSICKHYGIPVENVCGHHEASPGRKCDPGGSLGMSMDAFREILQNNLRYEKRSRSKNSS